MICREKGLLEIAERNQIKERSNIRTDIFGYRFQKGFTTVTTNNAYNKNLLPFFGSLQERATFREDNRQF